MSNPLRAALTSLSIIATLAAAAPAAAQGAGPDLPDEPGISPLDLPTAPPAPPPAPAPDPRRALPQPPPLPEAPETAPPPREQQLVTISPLPQLDVEDPRLKSPGTAVGLSLGLTLGSLAASIAMVAMGIDSRNGAALIAAGFTVGGLGLAFGPSAGHFYAGDVRRGLGMGFGRLAALGGGFGLGVLTVAAAFGGDEAAVVGFFVCGLAAGVTAIGLAIWDIAAAPGAARRANARRVAGIAGLNVGPLITDAAAGSRGYGLALGGRF